MYIFADLFNICEHSWMLHETKNKNWDKNWKPTIKGFQGFRRGQSHNVGAGIKTTPNTTVSPFWCWIKTTPNTTVSPFWCWFKTSVLPTRLYLPPGDYSVMCCLLDNSVHCRSIFQKSYWVYNPPNVEGYHDQSTN
jgi:hypothetical protein